MRYFLRIGQATSFEARRRPKSTPKRGRLVRDRLPKQENRSQLADTAGVTVSDKPVLGGLPLTVYPFPALDGQGLGPLIEPTGNIKSGGEACRAMDVFGRFSEYVLPQFATAKANSGDDFSTPRRLASSLSAMMRTLGDCRYILDEVLALAQCLRRSEAERERLVRAAADPSDRRDIAVEERLPMATGHRDTLRSLAKRLGAQGYTNVPSHSGMGVDSRNRAQRRFRTQSACDLRKAI